MIKGAIEKEEFDPASYDKPITVAIPSLAQYLIGKALMLDLFDTFPKSFNSFDYVERYLR
ncbi:hypothetical protein QW180_30195 [Vibrio sinaloensis]|nr:hypothetical protein [Vibrio sinaloensis]